MVQTIIKWFISIMVIVTGLALMNDASLITDIVDLGAELFSNAKENVENMEIKDAAKLF